jgi:hypothetical protein
MDTIIAILILALVYALIRVGWFLFVAYFWRDRPEDLAKGCVEDTEGKE